MTDPQAKKTKPKAKKAKEPTVVNAKEIKAWLRGIQEFAPEGWTPTPEQWATVCEKIFLLDETEYQYADVTASGPYAEPAYVAQPAYTAIGTPAYTNAHHEESAVAPAAPAAPGKLAMATSPTESGMIPVTSANEVLEGKYKSSFS